MAGVTDTPAFDDRELMSDLSDRFERVRQIGDGEREFLAGVIDYYQTRTATKMTIAMERLAVLAAVTLAGDGGGVDLRDERHRQRLHPLETSPRRPARDGCHQRGVAPLDETPGMVVTTARDARAPVACDAVAPPVTAEMRTRAFIILGLSGLAVTQPLLDLFGQNPEFFVAGNYSRAPDRVVRAPDRVGPAPRRHRRHGARVVGQPHARHDRVRRRGDRLGDGVRPRAAAHVGTRPDRRSCRRWRCSSAPAWSCSCSAPAARSCSCRTSPSPTCSSSARSSSSARRRSWSPADRRATSATSRCPRSAAPSSSSCSTSSRPRPSCAPTVR